MSIISLLNQIKNDEIVLPAIQRNFVWSEDSTEKLLDSIMRGYPVGIVLLWETYIDMQYRSFVRDFHEGDSHTYHENRGHKKIKLVLDGQQRLQSLYIALYGTREGRSLYFDLLSGQDSNDLAGEKFRFEFMTAADAQAASCGPDTSPGEDSNGKHFFRRISELFALHPLDRIKLRDHVAQQLDLSDEDRARVDLNLSMLPTVFSSDDNVLKALAIDENLAPDSASRKSEADVLEIFVRINREGTPLSRSDLIFSMIKLNWRESAEALPEFIKSINSGNSFDLDADFVIRCLFVVSDLGARLDLNLLRKKTNMSKMRANFDSCCAAIRATVDFVQTDCACQSSALLGSSNTLIPFVYYLFHMPMHLVPNSEQVTVRQAVYLLAFARPFSRWGESRLSSYIRSRLEARLSSGDLSFPVKDTIGDLKYWARIGSVADLLHANTRLAMHLIQGRSGARVQYESNSPEIDHIFPRAQLRKRGVEEALVNDVANFWILAKGKNRNKSDQHPAKYFEDVDDKVLDEALIDRSLFDYDQYGMFLNKRGVRMVEFVSQKIGCTDGDFA